VLDGGNEVASFVYDGTGRRSQKIVGGISHTYVYDGNAFLEERLSTGATIRYVHGRGIDRPLARVESGVASYYLADHLGSIVQTTDATATLTLTRQYDGWGNLLQGSGTAGFAFTGREWDPETGLYYYRARYYANGWGRFLSEDPIGLASGVNRYAYVANNPIVRVDPHGLDYQPSGAGVINLDPTWYMGYGEPGPGQSPEPLPIRPTIPPVPPAPSPNGPNPPWWDIDFICTKDGWKKVNKPVVIIGGKAIGAVPPPPDWKPPFECKPQKEKACKSGPGDSPA